ncbi:thiol reductant ABC exporter subunit CydC, partial [Bacteroides thetaiotaomicron]|nr:thiol reductant ABC exporter subunit CydC [Bacteroides thetaiotaomicron]
MTATTLSALTLSAALGLTVLSGWLITRAWEMPPVLDLSIAITGVRALGISRAAF